MLSQQPRETDTSVRVGMRQKMMEVSGEGRAGGVERILDHRDAA